MKLDISEVRLVPISQSKIFEDIATQNFLKLSKQGFDETLRL